MPAYAQRVPILDLVQPLGDPVEAAQHLEGLLIAYDLELGVALAQQPDGAAVVGLHVVDDEVVEGTVLEDKVELVEEDVAVADVHRVDERGLLVDDQVGIVGDALREAPHVLEERLHPVVDPYVVDRVGDLWYLVHSRV